MGREIILHVELKGLWRRFSCPIWCTIPICVWRKLWSHGILVSRSLVRISRPELSVFKHKLDASAGFLFPSTSVTVIITYTTKIKLILNMY